MPIYEFKCRKCGRIIEKMFNINENIKSIVCECNHEARRIISKPGVFDVKGYSADNNYSKKDK